MAKDPSMVVIRGRLAADPELRTVGQQGTPVANLRILSSGWEKDTAGQPVEVTPTAWNCEAWRSLAEHIAASLAKGSQVIAVARPRTDRFTAQDGTERWATRWVIDDIGPSLQRVDVRIERTGGRPAPATPPMGRDSDYETGEW